LGNQINLYLINGNDGGLNISMTMEHTGSKAIHMECQFYAVNVDEQEPYYIYGGM
jgi:hypothetical protein